MSAPTVADVDWDSVTVPELLSVLSDDELRALEVDAEESAGPLALCWLRGQLVREWRTRAAGSTAPALSRTLG